MIAAEPETTLVRGLADRERQIASAAVRGAEPLRQDWLEVWNEHQSDFAETVEMPHIPTAEYAAYPAT